MAYPKNLNEFYTELKNKGVKLTHQFQLQILGTGIDAVDSALENITMWAQGAEAPGRTQNTQDIQYLGYPFNVPTNFLMTNELALTINCEAVLLSVVIDVVEASTLSARALPICDANATIPVPSGLVRMSTSPGRAPEFVTTLSLSIMPVTAKPALVSLSLML